MSLKFTVVFSGGGQLVLKMDTRDTAVELMDSIHKGITECVERKVDASIIVIPNHCLIRLNDVVGVSITDWETK